MTSIARSDFDQWMTHHQVAWRRRHIKAREWGTQNGRDYEHIVPPREWEEGLWPGVREDREHSVADYLSKTGVQRHAGAHNLKSSWILCANLYFTFGATARAREVLAGFLQQVVGLDVGSVDAVELEYAEPAHSDLHPLSLLGESGGSRGSGQTSPDVAFVVNGGKGLVLTENKLCEHSFYKCSARTLASRETRTGNPDPSRCLNALAVLDDPSGQCHQMAWGRRYWDHLAAVAQRPEFAALTSCPAAFAGYQLLRQHALAEGIAQSGKYDLVASCLAIDARNTTLAESLKGTGLSDVRDWGKLFNGKARFAVFTHQQWVNWVRATDKGGEWGDWLQWIDERYQFTQTV